MEAKVHEMCPLLNVYDMQPALNFYCDVLGFEVVESGGPADDVGWVLLRLGGIWLMLNTQYELHDRPALPDAVRKLAHADTALYFGSPDLDSIYGHLKSKGIELREPHLTGYGFKAISLKDPDGYTIVFHWPVS
jgi:glyoxylase I family protein